MNLQQFQESIAKFVKYLKAERNFSRHTVASYRYDLNQLVTFWDRIEKQEPSNPHTVRTVIDRYLIALFHRRVRNSSIARKFSCLSSFERYVQREGFTLNLTLKRPRVSKNLPVYLSIDEMIHLLDKVSNEELGSSQPYRDRAILELLYATGIRCSELIEITMGNVYMETKSIKVHGKGNKERMVLFGRHAKKRLEDYLKYERSPVLSLDEPLFHNHRGHMLTSRTIQLILASFRKHLAIQRPITPHKIRHTFATHMLNQGADLRVVQELLGHQAITSTERYTHVSLDDLSRLLDEVHPIKNMKKKQKEKTTD